ncbi:uncharacterized protein B0H18DRAFT_487369 [Fomitopsis serialis]|uniref:uncharacterized protein n=1 Tax=Fomitopsis serialis TaxID=139415 RepID=UPI0020083230|nr:uncharacterized protein B0H18DRAFT_487369 [Neoantrodia serialis]KAH9934776.1 hypothetical protein B0H18DRAFT_487369 [Neoantrodia serialis]
MWCAGDEANSHRARLSFSLPERDSPRGVLKRLAQNGQQRGSDLRPPAGHGDAPRRTEGHVLERDGEQAQRGRDGSRAVADHARSGSKSCIARRGGTCPRPMPSNEQPWPGAPSLRPPPRPSSARCTSPGLLRGVSWCTAVLPADAARRRRPQPRRPSAQRPKTPHTRTRCYSPPTGPSGLRAFQAESRYPAAPPPRHRLPRPCRRSACGAPGACRWRRGRRETGTLVVASANGLARKPAAQVAAPEHPALHTQGRPLPPRRRRPHPLSHHQTQDRRLQFSPNALRPRAAIRAHSPVFRSLRRRPHPAAPLPPWAPPDSIPRRVVQHSSRTVAHQGIPAAAPYRIRRPHQRHARSPRA